MKLTTSTILQSFLVVQAVSFGAAKKSKRSKNSSSGKGKGGSSYGKGKGYSPVAAPVEAPTEYSGKGKGKGKSYSSDSYSGKGKGYSPVASPVKAPSKEDPDNTRCDAIIELLNDLKFKSSGAVVSEGVGIGERFLFSKNPVNILDGEVLGNLVGTASGYCTRLGIDTDVDVDVDVFDCQVTVDLGDEGVITHHGILDGDLIDQDKLVVTGGCDCFEGIVGAATVEVLDIVLDGELESDLALIELLLNFDVRVL